MEICVINLMRLGDLVQTTPVLRRLRAAYPGARLTLVAMDLFQETAGLAPEADRVVAFPSALLAAALERDHGWAEAVRLLWEWRRDVLPRPPRLTVNLTPNLLGGILAYLTGAGAVRGLTVGPDRLVFTHPAWTSYALIVSRARAANPFNLVDLFLKGAGLDPDGLGLSLQVPETARRQVERARGELGLSENTALVGLVPGASRPERQWPAESLAQAAGLLLQRRPCHFFILGTENERPLGEAVLRELPAGAATLLMGGLTAPLLAAHLEQLDLLITNDTGPMHLAAAVQTPVLALFLASARAWDTGPVGRGHLILEPRLDCHPCLTPCGHPRCRGLIPPETVADLAAARLLGVKGAPAPAGPTLSGVRLYETAVDPLGFHLPRPMVRRPLDRRHFWIMLHRLVWGELLDRRPLEEGERLAEWLTKRLDEDFLPPQDDLGLEAGLPVLREMVDLAGRGEATARQILRLARQAGAQPVRLWQAAQSLRSLDPALHRLALELPEAAAFVEFFFQEQRAGQEREVGPLSRALARAYRFLMGAGKRSLTGVRQLTGGTGRPVASHGVPRKMARTLHHQEQEKEEPHRPIEVTPCG